MGFGLGMSLEAVDRRHPKLTCTWLQTRPLNCTERRETRDVSPSARGGKLYN